MMTKSGSTMSASNIITLRDEALAMPIILSGVLDAKIAETRAAIDALNQREGIVQTLDQAHQIKHEAEAHAAAAFTAAKEQAEAAQATAKKMADDAAQKVKDADVREKQTMAGIAKLSVDRAQFDATKATDIKVMDQRAKALDARESDVAAAETALRDAQQKLQADRQAFNKRLEALKA
jgi:hypothetical protein